MCVAMTTQAQDIELNEQGAYERKEVVQAEGATAATLYDRAMIALSEWTGPDGKAKAGVDYQNQETHTIIYKGTYYLGFKRILTSGFDRYANFTLKVKCKDGKAQVTCNVPTITAVYSRNGIKREATVAQLVEQVKKAKGAKGERGEKFLDDLKETTGMLVDAMVNRLKNGRGDDDF